MRLVVGTRFDAMRRGGVGPGVGANPFTQANVIAAALPAGRKSVATLKVPGVDTLPAGATFGAGVVTVNGNNVLLEDWALSRVRGSGLNCTIRNCTLEDLGTGGADYPINHTGSGWTVEDCTFFGQGDPKGSSAFVVTSAANFTLRRSRFFDYSNDGLKLEGANFLIEGNRIGPARNNAGVVTYSAATYYPPGSLVSSGGFPWEKLSTAPAGTTPAAGPDWNNLDPHVDQITVNAGSGIIRYNHFETQGTVFGPTQRIRVIRNTGQSPAIGPVQIYGNVFDDWVGGYPWASGVVRPWVSRTYGVGELSANASASRFWRATASTSTDPEVDATNWTPDRDLNALGEIVWAHNWVNDGVSGYDNSDPAPVASVGNRTQAEAALPYPQQMPQPQAAMTAPTNVGDVISWTNPTRFGPAQVFTISAVTANGSASMGGNSYTNVCAIRVGVQVVALIDSSGFWYVGALSGVTMQALGGGSYRLRVYNNAGNPMSASVAIVAGSATVVAEANEVTTGPAWGVAPAVLLSDNIPNAYNHTVIQTSGQVDYIVSGIPSSHAMNLSTVPLANGDFTVGFVLASTNTNRLTAISTTGYTSTNNIHVNATSRDICAAIGYKQQGATPDTTFDNTSTAAAGFAFMKILRAYKNVSAVSYVTASGVGGNTPNPPSVTATAANSIALCIGVTTRAVTSPTLTASYGVNQDFLEFDVAAGLTVRITEVEIPAGAYDPPAMVYGAADATDASWWAATVLLTPV